MASPCEHACSSRYLLSLLLLMPLLFLGNIQRRKRRKRRRNPVSRFRKMQISFSSLSLPKSSREKDPPRSPLFSAGFPGAFPPLAATNRPRTSMNFSEGEKKPESVPKKSEKYCTCFLPSSFAFETQLNSISGFLNRIYTG